MGVLIVLAGVSWPGARALPRGMGNVCAVRPVCLDALLGLSLYGAEWFVVTAVGPGLGLPAGRLAVGRIISVGSCCALLGPQAHCPFKGKGSAISLALGVNGLA